MPSDYSVNDALYLAPGLVIEEDSPGGQVRLAWRGPPPNGWLRFLASAALLAGIGIWATCVYLNLQPLLAGAWQVDDLVIAAGVFVAGGVFLGYSGAVVGQGLAFACEFDWSLNEGAFICRQRGWLLWGYKTQRVPLSAFQTLWLELGTEGRVPLHAKLRQYVGDYADVDLTPLRLSRRSEAVELLFSLARLLSAYGYLCTTNSFRRQKLLVYISPPSSEEDDWDDDEDLAEGVSDEAARTVTAAPSTNYLPEPDLMDPRNIRPIPPRGELPPELLAPPPLLYGRNANRARFDPTAAESVSSLWRVEQWNPGETVRVVVPAAPAAAVAVASVFGIVVGGLAGWFPLSGFLGSFLPLEGGGRGLMTALAGTAGGLLTTFWAWNGLREQRFLFDWRERSVTWHNGSGVRSFPFDEINGLTFTPRKRSSSADGSDTDYGYRLDLNLRGDDVCLVTGEGFADPVTARKTVDALTLDLAESLGVPVAREPAGDSQPNFRHLYRFSPGQWVALAALALVTVGWLGSLTVLEVRAQITARQIRQLGIKIGRMGSFARDDRVIGVRYWYLETKDCRAFTEHAEQLRTLLARLPEVGLDLRQSNCTDEDLAVFRGLASIQIVGIGETKVADAGVASLAECPNLRYLDAYDCHFGDEAAAALGKLRKLQYLHLEGAHITDEGLKTLEAVQSLQVVSLGGTWTTPAGRQELRRALPRSTIVRP